MIAGESPALIAWQSPLAFDDGPEPRAAHWVVGSESAITGSFRTIQSVWRPNVARTARDDPRGCTSRQERSYCPLVHHGLRSAQRSSGLSALINLCTVPASGRTSDFGRRVGQLTLGCARTEAADRLGCPGAQSNLPVVRLTETVQMRAPVNSRPPRECRQDPLPMLFLSARYPNYFSSPI